ncbi:MAG TPA: hypothetical protein PK640_17205 [Verrucomicrobiota bacterium]|nr:hypothetical protein [Verrucomicrobiota bacterium]
MKHRLLSALVLTVALGLHPGCARGAEWAYQILHEFSSTAGGPWMPWELVQSRDGNLYASSEVGRSNHVGTVFRLAPGGAITTLLSFGSGNGDYPQEGLIEAADGKFYGTTYQDGGTASGAVFRITPQGGFTVLHRLDCAKGEGLGPICRLTQVPNGEIYGTTFYGGASGCFGNSAGTVFKLTPNGAFTTVVSFDGTNGSNPQCGLVFSPDGHFYGSTTGGGGPAGDGYGTIFRLTTNGVLTTLHTFDYRKDGSRPSGSLLLATDGNLYGTTEYGIKQDFGTIFRMAPDGDLTTLVNFNGNNGRYPHGDLIQTSNGFMYGRTITGGPNDAGTLFRLNANGDFTTILDFNGANGGGPWAALVQGRDGQLYGSTAMGGAGQGGVALGLSPRPELTNLSRSNDVVTLTWTSFTNGVYRVQQNTSLTPNNWMSLSPEITATADTTVRTFPAAPGDAAFYRVLLLQ